MLYPRVVDYLSDIPKEDMVEGLYVFATEETGADGIKGEIYLHYGGAFVRVVLPKPCKHCGRSS